MVRVYNRTSEKVKRQLLRRETPSAEEYTLVKAQTSTNVGLQVQAAIQCGELRGGFLLPYSATSH